MERVLIYYKGFSQSLGGGEFLPLLFIADLQKRGCDVTFAMDKKSDIGQVTESFGVSLDVSKLKIVPITPGNGFLKKIDVFFPVFKTRQLKKLARDADVCISAGNLCDFGKPAHHFISDIRFGDSFFLSYANHEKKSGINLLTQRIKRFLMKNLLRPLSGVRSSRSIITDLKEHIYPNSHYIEGLMRNYYGSFTSTVFYPPTIFEFHQLNMARNPLSIVYIGRIIEEKRLPDIIDIVERARELSGLSLELLIAGNLKSNPYAEKLNQIIAGKKGIRLVGALHGKEKEEFLLSGTYAIHAECDEAFGISVVEYMKAGIIPIVPDEGGTPEIVDNRDLTYHTKEDAAKILVCLLTDETFRKEQLNHCRKRVKDFSFEHYMESQHRLLDRILEKTT